MQRSILSMALLLLAFSGCAQNGTTKDEHPVLFFGASSTIDALESLNTSAEKKIVHRIDFSFAASSRLAKQIEQGAPADLFLSADAQWVDYLAERGLVAERVELLGNQLVVVQPLASALELKTPNDLSAQGIMRIAIADPNGVPAGVYAKQALTKLGLWEPLESKIVAGDDVRQALLFCERGEVEAAIVYRTDARSSTRVRVAFSLDVDLDPPIRYPLVLLTHGSHRPEARALFKFLSSATAEKTFRDLGFDWLSPALAPAREPSEVQ